MASPSYWRAIAGCNTFMKRWYHWLSSQGAIGAQGVFMKQFQGQLRAMDVSEASESQAEHDKVLRKVGMFLLCRNWATF